MATEPQPLSDTDNWLLSKATSANTAMRERLSELVLVAPEHLQQRLAMIAVESANLTEALAEMRLLRARHNRRLKKNRVG